MKRLLFAGLLGVITSLGLRRQSYDYAGRIYSMILWRLLFIPNRGIKGSAKVNIHLLR